MANKLKNKPSQTAKNVAVIMDGNGRWAVANSLNISKGHSKGVEIVREIVEESINQEISSLTLYAFSSENWSRPKSEVEAIKKLIVSAINQQVPDLVKQKVRLKFFGCIDDFGSKIISKIHTAEKQTGSYQQVLDLNVAIGYGGRQDIVNITKEISEEVLLGKISADDINEDLIAQFSCSPVDNIDLLIRTGGDQRISNFLLYQIAYTEICFVEKFWPDFTRKDFINCLNNFKKVSRRFGKRI
ncbi:MAG: polyprenyl diphosphate synthase [Proteobacteria bacterium]|nr:polyprenyl diphosphate synthase [Pseudomonadota bacterium]MDA0975958.1 polyprenyl diphosphate synthase [Pseudomonadota bacterium]MDA1037656.1 polyprenyl diphosphate synthase [Pseudomonadota bacterium]